MSDQPSKNSNNSAAEPGPSGKAGLEPAHAHKEGKEPTGAVEHDNVDNIRKIQDMHVEDDQSDSDSTSGRSPDCLLTFAARPQGNRYSIDTFIDPRYLREKGAADAGFKPEEPLPDRAKKLASALRSTLRQCLAYYRQVHGFPRRETDVDVDESLVRQWEGQPVEKKRVVARVRLDTFLRHLTWGLLMTGRNAKETMLVRRGHELMRKLDSDPEFVALTEEEDRERFANPLFDQLENEVEQLYRTIKGKGRELIKHLDSAVGRPVRAGRDVQDDGAFRADHEIWGLVSEYGPNGLERVYSEKMMYKFGVGASPMLWAPDDDDFKAYAYPWAFFDLSYKEWLNWDHEEDEFTWQKVGCP